MAKAKPLKKGRDWNAWCYRDWHGKLRLNAIYLSRPYWLLTRGKWVRVLIQEVKPKR